MDAGASPDRFYKYRVGNLPILHILVKSIFVQIAPSCGNAHFREHTVHAELVKTSLHQLIRGNNGYGPYGGELVPLLCQKAQFRVDQGKDAANFLPHADFQDPLQVARRRDTGYQIKGIRLVHCRGKVRAVRGNHPPLAACLFLKILYNLVSCACA